MKILKKEQAYANNMPDHVRSRPVLSLASQNRKLQYVTLNAGLRMAKWWGIQAA